MLKKLQEEKKIIDSFLLNFIEEEKVKFENQELAKEAFSKIKTFAINGKTVRGGLFLLATRELNKENYIKYQSDLLLIAAALELIHSGLLIHDDIIDQDEKRRGQDSVWHQYEKNAIAANYKESKNYGQNLAICLGSITQYLAFSSLEKMSLLPRETQKNIKQAINQEIIRTYFAEMLDSEITSQKMLPTIDQISQMYLFKTARYTFSLPLQLAGIANELENSQLRNLIEVGEKLGLIFQIKDDQISLFATEKTSGKSYVSDIKEGKKTLSYLTLLEKVNDDDKNFILKTYGKKTINEEEIKNLQDLFNKHATPQIDQLMINFSQEALSLIRNFRSKKLSNLLTEILEFNLNREF